MNMKDRSQNWKRGTASGGRGDRCWRCGPGPSPAA